MPHPMTSRGSVLPSPMSWTPCSGSSRTSSPPLPTVEGGTLLIPSPLRGEGQVRGEAAESSALAGIAQALKNAKRPLIISGTSLFNEAVIQAAANIAWALCESGKPAELCYTVPECNSMGLGLMGGKNLDELLKAPLPRR